MLAAKRVYADGRARCAGVDLSGVAEYNSRPSDPCTCFAFTRGWRRAGGQEVMKKPSGGVAAGVLIEK